MKKLTATLAILITFSGLIFSQDLPLQNQQQNTVEPRGDCIEVLNTSQFFAGEFGGNSGTASICFEFPSTCGAEIHLNSNHVVDFLQFTREDATKSGIIGVGKTDYSPIVDLAVGEVMFIPFSFSVPWVFEGPIQIDVSEDGFIVEKLADGAVGDMFVNADLYDFTATVLSNQSNFTNWSVECKPAHICLDYQSIQYTVACPDKDLDLHSKCFESGFVTTWINPFGDTIISETDILHVNSPVTPGLYTWFTPCNKGYWVVYNPDSISIKSQQVFCSSKKKLYLPSGLRGDWSTGAKNTNYVYVSQPGSYSVLVSDCVTDSIEVDIVFQELDLQFHLLPDVDTILFYPELKVVPEAISGTTFLWQKNGQPTFGYYGPGLYTVTGVYDECREQDTILVIPKLFSECDWPVYGPNVFSPNGDGENDKFEVFGPLGSTSEIWVYNRWGELIYHGDKWDGSYKGLLCNPGVYVFRARVVWNFEECSSIKGDITVIR